MPSQQEMIDAKEALYEQILDLFEQRLVYLMGEGENCIFVYGHVEAIQTLPDAVNGIEVRGVEMDHPPIRGI